jgi:DNA mismatch repair ATPase MutS
LAGLPQAVIERAKDVLARLERYELAVFAEEQTKGLAAAAGKKAATQVSLFTAANDGVIERLRDLDTENTDPDELRSLLADMQKDII